MTLPNGFEADLSERHNISRVPRSTRLASLVDAPSQWRSRIESVLPPRAKARSYRTVIRRNLHRPTMPRADLTRRVELYGDDVSEVESITGRDLSQWRRAPS